MAATLVGFADVSRILSIADEELRRIALHALAESRGESASREATVAGPEIRLEVTTPVTESPKSDAKLQLALFHRLLLYERREESLPADPPRPVAVAESCIPEVAAAPPPAAPLMGKSEVLGLVRRHARSDMMSREADLSAILGRISRVQAVNPIPRRRRLHWGGGASGDHRRLPSADTVLA